MKQTSFPSDTRQGLDRALSKPLQEGLGTVGAVGTHGQPCLVTAVKSHLALTISLESLPGLCVCIHAFHPQEILARQVPGHPVAQTRKPRHSLKAKQLATSSWE